MNVTAIRNKWTKYKTHAQFYSKERHLGPQGLGQGLVVDEHVFAYM